MIDGKCVRLTQGDYNTKKVYNEDPLEVAKMFEDHGIRRLHVVDLDGARQGRIINYRMLERLATRTSLIIDFGGGLKQEGDLEIAFESGAQMVTGGSIAVKNPEIFTSWITKFGPEKIILGADVKDKKIAISGWEETTDKELILSSMIITTMVSRRQSVRTSTATVCCKDLPSNYIKRYRNKYLCFI